MPLELTKVIYVFTNDAGTQLASVEYDSEANTVKIVKGNDVESLTIPSDQLDNLRLLLQEVKNKITEQFD